MDATNIEAPYIRKDTAGIRDLDTQKNKDNLWQVQHGITYYSQYNQSDLE